MRKPITQKKIVTEKNEEQKKTNRKMAELLLYL